MRICGGKKKWLFFFVFIFFCFVNGDSKNHIEKNEGCNHMTCRCGYEFCWLCKKDWKVTGYGHTCNKPKDIDSMEKDAKDAESFLKRYMFYFSRYEAHEKSAKFARDSLV